MTTHPANTPDIAAGQPIQPDIAVQPVIDAIDGTMTPGEQLPAPPSAEPEPAAPVDLTQTPFQKRELIAERLKLQRMADTEANLDELSQLAATGLLTQREPEAAPQPVVPAPQGGPAPPAPEISFQVKVRGNEYTASREQLLKMAQMSEEEAQGLPDAALVRTAQMIASAQSYLSEARDTQRGTRPADRDTGPTPEPNNSAERQTDPDRQKPQNTTEKLKDLTRKLQFGDEEEAAPALMEAVDVILSQRDTQRRSEEAAREVDSKVDQFFEANTDFADNGFMTRSLFAEATEVIKDRLAEVLQVDRNQVDGVIGINPVLANKAYNEVIVAGFKLPPPEKVLEQAAASVRQSLGRTPASQAPSNQPAQPPSATDMRLEAKRAIPQSPQRSGLPSFAMSDKPPSPFSMSDAINAMKRGRGQAVRG